MLNTINMPFLNHQNYQIYINKYFKNERKN